MFYDVILALIYIASDAYLIYFYLSQVILSISIIMVIIIIITIDDQGDVWWGAATIAAVCLPGLLGDHSPFIIVIIAIVVVIIVIVVIIVVIVINMGPVAWLLKHTVV